MNIEFPTKRRFIIILGCLTGMGALSIDMSLPSIPDMVIDLSSNLSAGQLIIGVFLAGFALGQLPAGLLSDRIGRIPILLSGTLIFIFAGIITSLATSIEVMLLGRFLQGLGASAGVVVSRAIVRDIASGKKAASILSIMVMVFTATPMLAPVIGAYLVSQFSWRAPFIAITIFGAIIFFSITNGLYETKKPDKNKRIKQQFYNGIKEFFSHKESIIGMLLIVTPTMGYMSMISASSSLIIGIYNFPVKWFGPIFAMAGLMVLIGSAINRRLLKKFNILQIMGLGSSLIGLGAVSLIYFAWQNQASFIWLWCSICIYMFGTSFLISNATAMALDPAPKIAGIAASTIGTIQNLCSSLGAIITGIIYNNSIRNTILVMAIFGFVTLIIYLLSFKVMKKNIANLSSSISNH